MRRATILTGYIRSIVRIGEELDKTRLRYIKIDCAQHANTCKECSNVIYNILSGGDIIINSYSAIAELKLMNEHYPNTVSGIICNVISIINDLLDNYSFIMKSEVCSSMNHPQ